MNREFWKDSVSFEDSVKPYPCPRCHNANVALVGKMHEVITPDGEHYLKYNYPNGIDYLFSGMLQCENYSCKEVVAFGGLVQQDIEVDIRDDEGNWQGEHHFSNYVPKYFYPNLRMFQFNSELSDHVKKQLDLSFASYYNDLSSSANRLRTAIEYLLDDMKAPKYRIARSGKRHYLTTLHGRIENFEKKKKKVAELLLAIKFIGNEGSHVGKVEVDDILDGYEILEHVLEILYKEKKTKIDKIAKEIRDKKSPRSK